MATIFRFAPVPAGSCFVGLDERIGSFEQAVTDATYMPGDDPVPVFFDGLDKLLQRLRASRWRPATRC